MKTIELHKRRKFYLLGVGGISMSTLAIFLKKLGNFVSGSDITSSKATEKLERESIEVDFSLSKEKIKNADYIICSSAIKEGNEQLEYAMAEKKQICTRGQLLGAISKEYEKVIAVAGSHGKTTTTAMIYEVLKCAGEMPTLHLGGFRCEDDEAFCVGKKRYFVTEACEYCDNFLFLHPYLSVITNIEKEHMDYFKTFERQLKSFEQFRRQSQIVVEADSNYSAKYLRHRLNGELSFSIYKGKEKLMRLNLQICEEINAQNCIYAYRACKLLGLSNCQIKLGLENFRGVRTRFEKVSCPEFQNVICDYSHHPTEISKAIYSARKIFKGKKLIVVFQPHTFSRTKDLLKEFLQVLKKVDFVVLYKTYSAREKESEGISAKELAKLLSEERPEVYYAEDFAELRNSLSVFNSEDVLMFVGAGDLPVILHKNNFIS